jgi:hypothetical protein
VETGELPIPDDGPEWLEIVFDQIKVGKRKDQKMTIEIYERP